MKIVFATHNTNKLKEVQLLLPNTLNLLSLTDIDCHDEIPETADTLEGNAILKANYVTQNYGYPCFADDTGLLVDHLNGAPGVYTARYAGPEKSAATNMEKLLKALANTKNRKAHFKTAIALNINQETQIFTGIIKGQINTIQKGIGGFGYDPVFIPNGYHKTFAELPLSVKNTISHRAIAVQKLVQYLKQL